MNTKIRGLLLLALSVLPITCLGQTPKPDGAQQPQGPSRERAEVLLSKAVVRITGKVRESDLPINGTGFIVAVPDSRLTDNTVFMYLVTNRHVAEAIAGQAHLHILEMNAVVNLKTPVNGTRVHEVPLPPQGPFHWRFPQDPSIDLAAIPMHIDDAFDLSSIHLGLFLTEDVWPKYAITPGDKVMTCGYFLHYPGSHRFQPIVREGSLAMVPDDVMNVPIGGKARIYLADLHVIPGNSGSPLFLAPAMTLGGLVYDNKGGVPYGLLGVVSGFMWEDDRLTLHAATDYEGTVHANSGIAMVVPADQLKDFLINDAEFKHDRDVMVLQRNVPSRKN
jgi:hypothetical protein